MKIDRKWILVISILIGIGNVDGQVNTVYTYNGDNIGFDSVCKGYAWQQLGLLDQNGVPINVPNNQIIRDGNKVIGYRNASGQLEAYDLTQTELTTAYNKIINVQGGSLTTCGHGRSHTDTRDGDRHNGGELLLGEIYYAGFDTGTKIPESQPYDLRNPPAKGKNINIHLHHCWTSNDPDGQGSEISVVTSLNNFLGGGGQSTGHDGMAGANITIGLRGPKNLVQNTTDTWNNTARNHFYNDYLDWSYLGLNLNNRYATLLNDMPQDARAGGVTFKIIYMLPEGQQDKILEQNNVLEEPFDSYVTRTYSSCIEGGKICGNTPHGQNIIIDDQESGTRITFDNVHQCGNTYIHSYSQNQWGPLPDYYQPIKFYDINTTAEYSGTITIDIMHNADVNPNTIRLLHYDGIWNDITISVVQNIITGRITSLSPFAVVTYYTKIIKGHGLRLGGIILLVAILFIITKYRK